MERSTHKDERGYYLTGDGIYVDDGDPVKFRGVDVDRLAAYEDTGLEPEDVAAPTIDAVPVVKCRECKHYQHYGKTSLLEGGKHIKAGWCYRRIRFDEESRMPADGFCSYGQRKEADHEAEKEPAPDI